MIFSRLRVRLRADRQADELFKENQLMLHCAGRRGSAFQKNRLSSPLRTFDDHLLDSLLD